MTTMDLSEQDKAAIRAITHQHVTQVLARDWEGYAATVAPDGIILPPDSAPLHGPVAAADYLRGFPEVLEFTADADRIIGTGNLAMTQGQGSLTLRIDGQPVKGTIKFLAAVRKEPDGRWLMIADMWNAGPAA